MPLFFCSGCSHFSFLLSLQKQSKLDSYFGSPAVPRNSNAQISARMQRAVEKLAGAPVKGVRVRASKPRSPKKKNADAANET